MTFPSICCDQVYHVKHDFSCSRVRFKPYLQKKGETGNTHNNGAIPIVPIPILLGQLVLSHTGSRARSDANEYSLIVVSIALASTVQVYRWNFLLSSSWMFLCPATKEHGVFSNSILASNEPSRKWQRIMLFGEPEETPRVTHRRVLYSATRLLLNNPWLIGVVLSTQEGYFHSNDFFCLYIYYFSLN